MAAVSVHDASTKLSHLIERALGGEEIVVVRGGTPVARLEPVAGGKAEPPRKRRLGTLKGEFDVPDEALLAPLPDDVMDAFHNGPVFPSDDDEERRT